MQHPTRTHCAAWNERFIVKLGETLIADVLIQNSGIEHNLVPGERDFYECWVQFTAKDSAGPSHGSVKGAAPTRCGTIEGIKIEVFEWDDPSALLTFASDALLEIPSDCNNLVGLAESS